MLIDLTGIKYLGSPANVRNGALFYSRRRFFGGCGVIEAVLTPL